jgi:hypothetical protein
MTVAEKRKMKQEIIEQQLIVELKGLVSDLLRQL